MFIGVGEIVRVVYAYICTHYNVPRKERAQITRYLLVTDKRHFTEAE